MSRNLKKKLLDCEWTILWTLWGNKPLSMKEIIENVRKRQPEITWSYKTYHTYLCTMLKKGLIGCNVINAREKHYFAILTHEDALKIESESLISRIRTISLKRFVTMIAEGEQMTENNKMELIALYKELNKKEGESETN